MASEEKARAEMLFSALTLILGVGSRTMDSNIKESQASQLKVCLLRTKESIVKMLTSICMLVAKIFKLFSRRMAREVGPRLNNKLDMENAIKALWMSHSSSVRSLSAELSHKYFSKSRSIKALDRSFGVSK